MKKKGFAKGIATCLAFAMVMGNMPETQQALAQTNSDDNVWSVVTESTVSGGAVSGGAVSGGDVSDNESAMPTSTPEMEWETSKLGAPSVKARAGSSRVRLSWEKKEGADGYYLYMRTSSENAYSKVATLGNVTEYTKKSLTNGTRYYFCLSAYCNVNGKEIEGDLSEEISAKPSKVDATSKTAKKYSTKAKFLASPAYKTYKKTKAALNYDKSFAIPGMKTTNVGGFASKTMVPQGICLAGSYFLISAYDSKNVDNSVVYVVSRSSKSYITTIVLPSKAKVGGMAYDGKNVWISKGKAVACFPYQRVIDAVNAGTSYTILDKYTNTHPLDFTASYMGCYNDTLWIGTFSQSTSEMKGYKITEKDGVPVLTTGQTMSVPSKTQGVTFDSDGTLLLTRSYRTRKSKSGYISQIRTYRPSYQTEDSDGKIKKNAATKVTTLPPMAEGVAIYGTYSYVLFSSSCYTSCKYPVDRVLALKTSKLLS